MSLKNDVFTQPFFVGLEQEILQSPSASLPKPLAETSPKDGWHGSSSLVEKILNGGSRRDPPPQETPLSTLNEDVKQVVKALPSLSFMKAKVLMFPIRGDAKHT